MPIGTCNDGGGKGENKSGKTDGTEKDETRIEVSMKRNSSKTVSA